MLTYNFEKKLKLNFSANIAEYLPVLSKVGAENSWSSRVGLAGKGESDFKRTFQGQANILQQATGIEWVQANQFLKLFLLTGSPNKHNAHQNVLHLVFKIEDYRYNMT